MFHKVYISKYVIRSLLKLVARGIFSKFVSEVVCLHKQNPFNTRLESSC